MLKEANGEIVPAAEAERLRALSTKAMTEAVGYYRQSERAFQIAAMLASEAKAVLEEGRRS